MRMEYAASSRIGKRPRNEDRFYIPVPDGAAGLAMVADGMGGHRSGDIASSVGAEAAEKVIRTSRGKAASRLKRAVSEANRAVFTLSREQPECEGMGTTMTVALAGARQWTLAQVGDSRAYLWENGTLCQLTQDHSLVAEMVRQGTLTPEEARVHPHRNIITRAVGTALTVETDIYEVPLTAGQTLLLCSDGLTDPLTDGEIADWLGRALPLQEIAEGLTAAAEENGGTDNITAVLVRVGEEVTSRG